MLAFFHSSHPYRPSGNCPCRRRGHLGIQSPRRSRPLPRRRNQRPRCCSSHCCLPAARKCPFPGCHMVWGPSINDISYFLGFLTLPPCQYLIHATSLPLVKIGATSLYADIIYVLSLSQQSSPSPQWQLSVPQTRSPSHSLSLSQSPSPSAQKPSTPLLQHSSLPDNCQDVSLPRLSHGLVVVVMVVDVVEEVEVVLAAMPIDSYQ